MVRRGREGAAAPTPLAVLGQVLVFHPQERTVWVTRTSLPPPQACALGVRGSPWDKTRAKVCGGPATISAISSGANVTLTARVLYWVC